MPSSSGGRFLFVLVGCPADPNYIVAAKFQFGANGTGRDWEYALKQTPHEKKKAREVAGEILWDPAYTLGSADPFYSVAPVRLILDGRDRKRSFKWSVGTSKFIELPAPSFHHLHKIQIEANVIGRKPSRLVQWDFIDVRFFHQNGYCDQYRSPCLPHAASTDKYRNNRIERPNEDDPPRIRQYIEVYPSNSDIVGFRIEGQVTLRANHWRDADVLAPDDLCGEVRVYTVPPSEDVIPDPPDPPAALPAGAGRRPTPK